LLDDIFRVDQDGQTKYQKVYSENLIKNLIESAYFTTKGNAITDKIKRNEQTNATKDLKRKLRSSKNKRTTSRGNNQDSSVSANLGLLSKQLL